MFGHARFEWYIANSCNMGTSVLLDMYTLIPWACSPQDEGAHIRQKTHAHVTTISYVPLYLIYTLLS